MRVVLHSSKRSVGITGKRGGDGYENPQWKPLYSWLLSNLLAVPSAIGGVEFSVRRPNARCGTKKKLTDVAENAFERLFIDDRSDLVWGQGAVDAEEVCGETSNVRSSH